MARGRMIASTVADDKRFNELPLDAALVYLMAIPQLDRDGLILGEPGVLWGQVCRRRDDLRTRMESIISAWLRSGLVTAYKNEDGDTILHFSGFQKNQAMTHYDREGASRFPCPPGYVRTNKGLVPDESEANVDDDANKVRSESGEGPDQIPPNVNQCNVIEGKGTPDPLPTFSERNGNGYFGMPTPKRRDGVIADGYTQDAHKLGVNPETYRAIVDELIKAAGWTALIDAGSDTELNYAKADALKLIGMGNTTVEHISRLVDAYRKANTWRDSKAVTPKQLREYASQLQQGVAPTGDKPKVSAEDDEKKRADLKAANSRINTARRLGVQPQARDLAIVERLNGSVGAH